MCVWMLNQVVFLFFLRVRYLSPVGGDFTKQILTDIWTERTPDGDWQVPGADKLERKEAYSDWYKWLHK
jgi:hypothetical protein